VSEVSAGFEVNDGPRSMPALASVHAAVARQVEHLDFGDRVAVSRDAAGGASAVAVTGPGASP
jgi:hypothetical protein